MTPPDASRALALLAFFLPILAGGNVFLFLDPRPALLGMTAITAIVAVFWTTMRPAEGEPRRVAVVALLALFAIHVLNLWLRPSGPRAGGAALTLGVAALLYVVFERRPLAASELRLWIVGLAAGTSVTVAYGQYQYWYAFPLIAPMIRATGAEPILSVNANFYNANSYAPFLAAAMLLLAAITLAAERGAWRLAGAVALAPLGATLWLTGSRATIALLAAAVALALWRRLRRKPAPTVAWTAAAALATAGVAVAWLTELVQVGLLGRLRIWAAALRMISDHWLGGVGLGRFAEAFPRYQLNDYFTRYPHNLWLEMFAEMGILAAVCLMVFLVSAGGAALARVREGTSPARLAAALASLLLVLHALVDIDWQAPANPILLVLLLAIAGADERAEAPTEPYGRRA